MSLQQNIEKQLRVPILNILRSYSSQTNEAGKMSICDIFNAKKFLSIVLSFINHVLPHFDHHEKNQYESYEQVSSVLKEAALQLGIKSKGLDEISNKFLNLNEINFEQQTISSATWLSLRLLCGILFQIMLKNQKILYMITKMQEKYQLQIKEYIEGGEDMNHIDKEQASETIINKLHRRNSQSQIVNDPKLQYDKIFQLENALNSKDQELIKTKQKLYEIKEQLSIAKGVLHEKQIEMSHLKGRLSAYSQADVLFQEKDQQIRKLNDDLNEIKKSSHFRITQLNSQMLKLKQKVNQLEEQKNQLSSFNEELANKNQLLTSNKQQAEMANRKVISNLKQKIKNLNEKIAEQQKSLMDVLLEKQKWDKQIFELQKKSNFNSIKKSKLTTKNEDSKYSARKSCKLVDQLGDLSQFQSQHENVLKQYFEVLFDNIGGRCTGQICIALRSEYVRIVEYILEINNDKDSLTYITPQNRLDCILNQLKKMKQVHNENLKLKQKIVLMQSEGGKGTTSKDSIQQINKLKKKLLVLKRNLEDVQAKRKQELQILVGAFSESFNF